MLLRVGIAMLLSAIALAAVVAVVVNLSGTREPVAPTEPRAVETSSAPSGKTSSREPSGEREAVKLPVVSSDDWPRPSGEEVAATRGPRYYPPNQDAELTLTVDAIGLHDVPVISSSSEQDLDNGVVHVPQTPMPWEDREQKNVYLAGHRLGYPGTGSRLVFYNLDKLKSGDTVVLKDRSGTAYEYRVSEVFVVDPNADWAVDPVRGRDMVTLQTCTYPTFENRLIVRADRVGDADMA
jgi:sortase A